MTRWNMLVESYQHEEYLRSRFRRENLLTAWQAPNVYRCWYTRGNDMGRGRGYEVKRDGVRENTEITVKTVPQSQLYGYGSKAD